MEPYFFQGIVLPERAQLSLQFSLKFGHVHSGKQASARVSVVLNQVAVWIDTDDEWNVVDLRNVVNNIVRPHLDMLGFLLGHAYDLSITRVVNRERGVDYVFGIDTPCISPAAEKLDVEAELLKLRDKTIGPNGIYLNRCFGDLVSAMKHADDTAFYCYRAIESLRHHCAVKNGITDDSKSVQWAKFREMASCDESQVMAIKTAADGLRHGNPMDSLSYDRAVILTGTWKIVRQYLDAL
ncbi:hypothetical protein [Burkholderia multivorans]|uniref:hypothetical protein n=1 Tax=Burkholderia multivorans TaxID=87883 RepID=UPI001C211ECB|nr:hypothetical protein [Burkholderia multivorans]MBU9437956.1 hypothetical protein [Burkholderia multivorans]MCO8590313.1 hypothetical protein [Burkholderia multivorans]MCO8632588.1 hypothetical protein [Burkholderia multivorans]MCO8647149.1 hypothetical protein [Burkholderia multivorans]